MRFFKKKPHGIKKRLVNVAGYDGLYELWENETCPLCNNKGLIFGNQAFLCPKCNKSVPFPFS